jgi:hypothetical protein
MRRFVAVLVVLGLLGVPERARAVPPKSTFRDLLHHVKDQRKKKKVFLMMEEERTNEPPYRELYWSPHRRVWWVLYNKETARVTPTVDTQSGRQPA